ncbi:MAG: LptA/OstA family protein, partial [Verrucomicrobiales bacterium]
MGTVGETFQAMMKKQKSPFARIPVIVLLLVGMVGSVSLELAGQINIGGRVKDFVAPARDSQGRKSVLKGADARHLGNRIYQVIKPSVVVRHPDDTIEMVIDATDCLFNQNNQTAYSSNSLSVKTGDDKFGITGKGWRWNPSASHLIISNEVVALVRKSVVLTNNPAAPKEGATNVPPIRITSELFEHEGEVARFMKSVKVVDEQGTVTCDLLQLFIEKEGGPKTIEAQDNVVIQQGEIRATGGKAIYQIAQNILTLTNKPQWTFGERSGSSDLLVIDRTNQLVRAEAAVYMKIPRTALS